MFSAGIHIHISHFFFFASFTLWPLTKIHKHLSKRQIPERCCLWVTLSFSCSLIFTPESCVFIHFKSGAGTKLWHLLRSLGRWERTHHPHHLALAKRDEGTTCCIPWDRSGRSYGCGTSVSHSTLVPQTSVAFPIATGQVTSAFCALPAVGVIARHLRDLSQLTQLNLAAGSSHAKRCSLPKSFRGSAPSANCTESIVILQRR